MNTNLKAFLDMIAVSEGTSGKGDDGYNVLVGGTLFNSYKDHPRVLVDLPKLGIKSTAAGRYQILKKNYDVLKARLNLSDFSPASQDAMAIELIRGRGGLDYVIAGNFAKAVEACRLEWASLPGAGYGQHENKLEKLQEAYVNAGGKVVTV